MFDEGSGQSTVNSSGNGLTGTLGSSTNIESNDPTWICEANGYQLDFDRSSNQDIRTSSFTPPSEGSFAFWLKVPASPSSRQRIFGFGDGFEIRWESNDIMYFDINKTGGNLSIRSSSAITATDTWMHIAFNTSVSEGTWSLYINGVLDNSGNEPLSSQPASSLTIGGSTWRLTSDHLTGSLDDFRMYSGNLTQAEITTLAAIAPRDCVDSIHHYEIIHDGEGLTCDAELITIKACVDESCSTLSTESVSLDFIADSAVISSPIFIGSTTVSFNHTNVETLTLSLANATIAASNPIVCDDGSGTSCDLAFNDTGFRFLVNNDSSLNIPTQLSGKSSGEGYNSANLSLQAIKKNTNPQEGGCEAALVSTTDIELVAECIDPIACASEKVMINSTSIVIQNDVANPASFTSVSLDFGTSADNAAKFDITYPDAGKIQLHARYNIPVDGSPSGVYMQGSSNSFVVRPFGFYIEAIGNPKAKVATEAKYKKAGEAFATKVTAVQWQEEDDNLDNDGIPDNDSDLSNNNATLNFGNEIVKEGVILSHELIKPVGGAQGVLSDNTITSFTAGEGQTNNLSWSEVGIIKLTANLSSLPYIDANSITGSIPYVGRFIPDHFKLTKEFDGELSGGNGFVYTGQMNASLTKGAIGYGAMREPKFTITAESVLNNTTVNNTTVNYTGSFMKLLDAGIVRIPPLSDAIKTDSALFAGLLPAVVNESNGIITYTFNAADNFVYTRNTAAVVDKFPATIDLVITSVIDEDGITADDLNGNTVAGVLTMTPLRPPIVGLDIYFGRWYIPNTYGPETSPLRVPMEIQYWNGSNFVTNTNEYAQAVDAVDLDVTDIDLSPGITTPTGDGFFASGVSRDITLSTPGEGKRGNVKIEYDVPSWLLYDWKNTDTFLDGPYTDKPSATATFGIHRGNDRVIYWREVF